MTQSSSVREEEISRQAHRALTGWLDDQEAMRFLLNSRHVLPTDDIATLQQTISACKSVVVSRLPFVPKDPIVDAGDDSRLRAVKERLEVHAALAGLSWFPAMVNLREVLAFQKAINTEG